MRRSHSPTTARSSRHADIPQSDELLVGIFTIDDAARILKRAESVTRALALGEVRPRDIRARPHP